MTTDEPRPAEQRKADTLAKLRTPGIDAWVATASAADDGTAVAHLVPLSLAWIDDLAVIAIASDSPTAQNLSSSRSARMAVGQTRDVVIIDSVLDEVTSVEDAPTRFIDGYCAQADWDPRAVAGDYVLMRLRPRRIQAWRESNEIAGRTLMRDGSWIA